MNCKYDLYKYQLKRKFLLVDLQERRRINI